MGSVTDKLSANLKTCLNKHLLMPSMVTPMPTVRTNTKVELS